MLLITIKETMEWWLRGRRRAKRRYSMFKVRRGGREELPHARGQGQQPEGATPTPEARGGGQEEQPHVQGAVAAWAQEGLEELFHLQGQKGWR